MQPKPEPVGPVCARLIWCLRVNQLQDGRTSVQQRRPCLDRTAAKSDVHPSLQTTMRNSCLIEILAKRLARAELSQDL